MIEAETQSIFDVQTDSELRNNNINKNNNNNK